MTAKTRKLLLSCSSLVLVALLLLGGSITASATNGLFPYSITLSNSANVPYDSFAVIGNGVYSEELGNYTFDSYILGIDDQPQIYTIADGHITADGEIIDLTYNGIPNGNYYAVCSNMVTNSNGSVIIAPNGFDIATDVCAYGDTTAGGVEITALFVPLTINTNSSYVFYDFADISAIGNTMTFMLVPAENTVPPTECPTLEQQIADYSGTWDSLANIIQANNSQLYAQLLNNWYGWYNNGYDNGLNAGYNNGFDAGFDEGHTEGYAEGFNAGLNGMVTDDPIDQYWNSTKDYILIAGQPYFAPNGFGSIDQYNTVGIYGEHESKLHRADGTTQTFNGQFVTQFAGTGSLGGGWYKIGATVGDENAYEQTLTPTVNDKAYYVSRVSPLGDPTEEFLVAVWLDGYEAWYVAEEYAHAGTVANNNKSYKQVYSIYMTDIRPTAQRFVNYDNPTLHETFNEDIKATLYLATFNQLNNYNVYTDDIGIVESYNNGFDAGANTTLWTDLISQPVVAFFSIPLAQVIVEGVTYTLTYGTVLGAGIVGLIVIWFLKLFAGG